MNELNDEKTRKATIWILIVGFLFTLIVGYIIFEQKKLDFITAIGIIGSIASFAGISIAYVQIVSLKEISKYNNRIINVALNELFKSFSIADISKSIKLVQEIQSLIRSEKSESALLRMQDLKAILIQINHINILDGKYNQEDYKIIMTDLNIDISNLNSLLVKQKTGINFLKVLANLETLATFFNVLENKLIYDRDG
jgi:hypothetical protein